MRDSEPNYGTGGGFTGTHPAVETNSGASVLAYSLVALSGFAVGLLATYIF